MRKIIEYVSFTMMLISSLSMGMMLIVEGSERSLFSLIVLVVSMIIYGEVN